MPLKMQSMPNSKGNYSFLGKVLITSLFFVIPFYSSFAQVSAQTISDFWLWQFFGRLHPLIVHFPIALLIFAGALELVTIRKYNSKFRPGIQILVLIGAVSAVIAAMFGWLLANSDGVQGELLDLHQQVGIATAVLSLFVLFFLYKVSKNPLPNQIKLFRTSLLIACLGVSVTGHFGASLTHGEEFLTDMLPWNEDFEAPESLTVNLAEFTSDLSENQEMLLVTNVRSVLAHNCYKCHSGSKIEGELRLDEKEYIFKGGENGPVISPGNPSQSELIRRVSLSKNHKDAMPSKGKLLSKEEIALLTLWIEKGAPWPEGVSQQSLYRVADLAPRKPSLPAAKAGLENPIDRWVDQYFQANEINWNAAVDDRTFLRRIYLDVIGLLPSPEDLRGFQDDPNPQKRQLIAQQLLDQKEDYTQHWMTFWNDILRNDYTGTGYITRGRFAITGWLYTSIRDNKAYDLFVKELLNPTEKSKGFIEGIRWRGTVNASQRTEMQAAQNVGQVILGLNLKCASCHDSFISDWKLEEAYAFANVFADSTLEISRCEIPTGKFAKTEILWEELGNIDSTASKAQKLLQLADKLVQPSNGRMYRTIVNRVWKQMMGRGIVEPVDEMDNLPWSQDLLDWLAVDFVENGYDIKRLIYQITSSKIYQSESVPIASPDLLLASEFKFQGLIRRRMTAEQFSDAVSHLASPLFDSAEVRFRPYELIPEFGNKAEFARASLVANNPFLTSLGRPNREIVSTSRDSQASLLQALELTNGIKLNTALEKGGVRWVLNYSDPKELTLKLFAQALLRAPTPEELEVAKRVYGAKTEATKTQDLLWSIFLLPEFQMIY
jgi:uncharacterized membrane protein